jgi:CRP-like cAMP-binding protein
LHGLGERRQCRVADVPRDVLQELVLARPAIGTAIIQLTLVESSILREWVVNVGRRDARARIAHIHTNRTLQSLRKEGLIQLSAKSLSVLDWDRLSEVADFDELYLHQQV